MMLVLLLFVLGIVMGLAVTPWCFALSVLAVVLLALAHWAASTP